MNVPASLAKALPSLFLSDSPADRICYARDLWPRHHLAVMAGRIAEHAPAAVAWPNSPEQAAETVRFCAAEGIPLVPFGAGSGVCGGILPNERTVLLDLKRMQRIRALDVEQRTVSVEAGALGIRLEEDLNAQGFTLGHFPSSILCSTVGGWLAARSAGQCSGRYGKIEDMAASLECIAGTGEILSLHRRTQGPDLTPLLIGSEGILGVITAATLRLHPYPKARAYAAFSCPSIEAGWTVMRDIFQAGLRPAVARLYDPFDSFIAKGGSSSSSSAKSTKDHKPHTPGAGAAALRRILRSPERVNHLIDRLTRRVLTGCTLVLLWENDTQQQADDEKAVASAIAARMGARSLGEAPARRWLRRRYSVSYRQSPMLMAGTFADTMEVAASWSKLGDLYANVRQAIGRRAFIMAHLSHVYPDGCSIYFTFAASAPTPAEMENIYDSVWTDALDAAIASGGTLAHHHGVGRSKAPKLGTELGVGIDLVRALSRSFDPAGILNPGNLLPPVSAEPRPRVPVPAIPRQPELDRESMLLHAAGTHTLGELEAMLAPLSLSLNIDAKHLAPSMNVADYIARGAPFAPDPWEDPVDHFVAGFTATLRSGVELGVRPSPRRSVGPDLFALFLGTGERIGRIRSAYLRVHSPNRPAALRYGGERNPNMTAGEEAMWARIEEMGAIVCPDNG